MLNPLEVEQKYQDLNYLLSFPASAFHRLHLIAGFIESLGPETGAYESYLLQIAERLPQIVDGVTSGGIPPEALESVLSALKSVKNSAPSVNAIDGYDSALEILKERTVESALYASDLSRAVQLLGGTAQKLQQALELHVGSNRHSEIDGLIQATVTTYPALSAGLQRAMDTWNRRLSPPRQSVYIPVVEQSLSGDSHTARYGTLRCATMEVGGQREKKGDILHTDVAVFGAESAISDMTSAPVAAARALFQDKSPRRKDAGLSCHLHLEPKSGLHEGSSANLAVSALFYCAILWDTNQRIQYGIRPDVAITGDVHEDGAVLPVDEDGLAAKVETVFYSHIETFVVPKEQLSIAEKAVEELRERFPGRTLYIVGVSHLQELFYDLRVIEQIRVSVITQGVRYIWRNRVTVAGFTLIAALLLILGKMVYGPMDKNPVSAELKGEELLLKNTHGDVVESIPVGEATVNSSAGSAALSSRMKPVVFFDMNSDGINEFVYVKKSDATEGSSDSIICAAVGRDRPLWAVSSRREIDFPFRTDTKSSLMAFSDLEVGDLEGNGKYRVYGIANSRPSFPGLILAWDASNGQELGCYVNIGHVNDIVLADINGDGAKEVLACGSNNALHAAALIVLDPRRLNGCSPTRGTYVPEGMPRASEELYAIIPRTVVGEQYMEKSFTNPGLFLEVMPDERKFSITVSDAGAPDRNADKPLMATIKYTFSYDFVLTGLGPEDAYDQVAQRLLKEGRIASVPDEAYFREFAGKILMWKGDHFESITALRKNGLVANQLPQVRHSR